MMAETGEGQTLHGSYSNESNLVVHESSASSHDLLCSNLRRDPDS